MCVYVCICVYMCVSLHVYICVCVCVCVCVCMYVLRSMYVCHCVCLCIRAHSLHVHVIRVSCRAFTVMSHCSQGSSPQPLWKHIEAEKPGFFLWLGDGEYEHVCFFITIIFASPCADDEPLWSVCPGVAVLRLKSAYPVITG